MKHDTISILRTERGRLAAAVKALDMTIAMLEGDESAVTMQDLEHRTAAPSLEAPPRKKTRGDRGGSTKPPKNGAGDPSGVGKKRRAPKKPKPPNGSDCDRGSEGGCSDDFYASRGCKKCGRVTQRCANHGGAAEVHSAALKHAHDHRWGRVDEHGLPTSNGSADDDGDSVGDGADHPGRMSWPSASLPLDRL